MKNLMNKYDTDSNISTHPVSNSYHGSR